MMAAIFLTHYCLLHMGNNDYTMLEIPFAKTFVYSARIIKKSKGARLLRC